MSILLSSLSIILLFSYLIIESNTLNEIESFIETLLKEKKIKHLSNENIYFSKIVSDLEKLSKFVVELDESKEKCQTLSNLISSEIDEAVLILRKNGEIVFKNKKTDEVLKLKHKRLFYEAIRNVELLNIISTALKEEKPVNKNISIDDEDFSCKVIPTNTKDEKLFLVILRKENTIEKDTIMKVQFLEAVSHEMKTPLSSILGTVEIIENESFIKKSGVKFLNILKENAQRLNKLIERILKLSEFETFKGDLEEVVNLKKVAENIVKKFESILKEKGLDFIVEVDDISIKGNRLFLEDILTNLVENAVKYTEKGYVSLRIYKEGHSAIIEVKDTGKGIKEENLEKIFEPFYREDKSRNEAVKGTGLGLTITKKLVNLLKGKIEVHSKIGEGTTFKIIFPSAN